ncbi:hypothetical protein B0H11DRAFT_1943763 [Mycena galericulata]|nr:hypothetical protein B0H11DRAFT_1943763 [Mycena galericulata]
MDPEVGTFRGRFKSGLFIHCPPHLKGLLKDELSGAISSEKKDVLFSSAERGVERISFGGAFSRTETKTFLNLGKCRRKSNFQHKPRVHPEVHLEYTQRQIYVELKYELIDVLRGERRAEEGPANPLTHRPQDFLHCRVYLSKAADRGEGEEFAVRDLAGAFMDVALAAALEESEVEEAFWGAVREAAERLGAPRTAIVPPLYSVTADPNERSGAPLALPVFPLTAGHVLGVAALEGDLFKQGGGGDTMPAEIADVGVEDAGNEVNIPLALARVRLGLAAGDERGDSGAVQRALRTGRRGVREGGCRWVHPDVLRVGGAKRRGKRKNGGEDAETAVDARKGRCPEDSKKVKEGAPGRWMRAQRVGQSPEKGGEAREVTAKHWKEDRQRERITSRVDSKENEIEAEDGTNKRRPPWSRGASSSMPGWARIPTLSYPPFPVSPPSPPFRTPPPPHSPIQLPSFSFSFSPTLLLLSRDGTAQRGRTRAATSSWGAVDVPRGVVVDVGLGRTRVGCRVLLVPVRAMDGSGRAGRLYTSALLASERGRWAWGPRAWVRCC